MIPIGDGNDRTCSPCSWILPIETDMIPIGDGNVGTEVSVMAVDIETDMIPIGDGNTLTPNELAKMMAALRQT